MTRQQPGQHRHLVLGASGFLGSHVVRRLVERGLPVRAMVRPTSSTRGLDDLLEGDAVELVHGDVHDADSVRAAMADVDVVHHCVVDARAWLRDPAPLHRTNVEGLRSVLEVAREHDLHRFVLTSSMGTLVGVPRGGHYLRSRTDGERLALSYAEEHGVPVVAMCVANTSGPGAHLPTPHGGFLREVVRGRMSVHVRGAGAEVVDVRDAAEAMVLAGERGRVGARYVVAAGFWSSRDLHDLAASYAGRPPARWGIPVPALAAAAHVATLLDRVRGREGRLTPTTVRLMHVWTPLDASTTRAELGWAPRPVEETVRDAVAFFSRPHR